MINFEYSLLPETRILVISSCAKTCFPDSPDVFSSVRARLYHSQALQAAQTCPGCFLECKNAPLPFAKRKNTVRADVFFVFTSVGTRFYHSQKHLHTYRSRKNYSYCFHKCMDVSLPFAKQQSAYRSRRYGFRCFRGYKDTHLPFVK